MIDGATAPGFEPVADVFRESFARGEELGAGFAAIQNGVLLVDLWGGHADRAKTRPWARDTLAPVYSATKPIAALVMGLIRDRFAPDLFEAPVAAFWPAFAAQGKGAVTVAQAMAHQAGVPGFVRAIDPALWLDPPALANVLAAQAPLWPPGSASGYHPTTWGYIMGALAQRIARQSLGALLRDEICAPRGIDFWIGLPASEDARVADMRRPSQLPDLGAITPAKRAAFLEKWSGPDRADDTWRRVEIPSANGHATARALAQLMSIYAQRGAYEVEPVVSEGAFAALTTRRFLGDDLVLPYRLDWRTGILGNNLGFFGPEPEAIGHYGWGGACVVADPKRGLSIGYAPNRQSHHLMGDPRPRALIAALYACLA